MFLKNFSDDAGTYIHVDDECSDITNNDFDFDYSFLEYDIQDSVDNSFSGILNPLFDEEVYTD